MAFILPLSGNAPEATAVNWGNFLGQPSFGRRIWPRPQPDQPQPEPPQPQPQPEPGGVAVPRPPRIAVPRNPEPITGPPRYPGHHLVWYDENGVVRPPPPGWPKHTSTGDLYPPGWGSRWEVDVVPGGGGGGGTPPGMPSTPGQVFRDPATVEWERLLRQYVGKLTHPFEAPDYQAMLKNLRAYGAQLRQPGYTPNERDLIQTGSIDPLAQARDAAKQRAITHLAERGISPSSGPAIEAMNEIDRQFAAQDASIRADFARQAIARDAQRAQQAAQLDILLPQLETQQFGFNEGRFGQGVESMFQIPQLADRRLGLAMQMLGLGQGPGQLGMGLQGLFQNQQQFSQDQRDQYMRWFAQLLQSLVGGFFR